MGRRYRTIRSLDEIKKGLEATIQTPTPQNVYFVIADSMTDAYLGGIDITSIDQTDRNGVLSIVVSEKEKRNSGIGTEAIRLILQYAFTKLDLNKVELRVLEGNISGFLCYQKAGFEIEGRLREHSVVVGKYRDMLCMAILKRDFRTST
jgi:RimJ/RimL family protein N-acetyltransferase